LHRQIWALNQWFVLLVSFLPSKGIRLILRSTPDSKLC
jgi:hypothetical protein